MLLNIKMPGMTGLELTKKLGNRSPLIIFTTAKTDYAVEAFELNVVDYLVKPVALGRFVQAIEKAHEAFKSPRGRVRSSAEQDFLLVKDHRSLKRINVDTILYLEEIDNYVKVYTEPCFYMLPTTFKSIEEKLPSSKFVRVHRSYIVSLGKIDFIQNGVITIGKDNVPIGDEYRTK
jgi:DNA-binding LytR/AlgR family response regulator